MQKQVYALVEEGSCSDAIHAGIVSFEAITRRPELVKRIGLRQTDGADHRHVGLEGWAPELRSQALHHLLHPRPHLLRRNPPHRVYLFSRLRFFCHIRRIDGNSPDEERKPYKSYKP